MQKQLARFVLIGSSFVALALAGCSGGAEVGQGPQASGNGVTAEGVEADVGHGRHDPATFAQRFDKNGDGTLDASELGPKRWERLKVADADGNGSVTSAELQAARQSGVLPSGRHGQHDGKRGRGQWLAKLDQNGDGVIDPSEAPERMRAKLDAADADHDGKVTVEELRASFAAHRGEHRFAHLDKNGDGAVGQDECDARVWQRIGRADANGDGRVTKEELDAARAQRVQAPH